MAAFSLVELMFAVGIAATFALSATMSARSHLDEVRTAGAARYVAARLQQARTRSVMRGRDTAMRIGSGGPYSIGTYEDGNGNGVLSADIAAGTDVSVAPLERLPDRFPGVDFGARAGLPGAEGGVTPGSDPIRTGTADGVTFTADGTATSGSLYLLGRGGTQYVVRIYGETGRTRLLRFYPAAGQWAPP
ncbi:MAG: GspH/FimT family pseudopilin [Vicinamibacterales bacterium]